MNQQLVERIRHCPSLPSLPGVAVEVLDLVQRPDADIAEIARLITKDPALAGKILRTVNSSFYARSQPVATLSQALVLLGLQSVKTLVLGFSLVVSLKGGARPGFEHVSYWKRSVYGATAARALAAGLNLIQQEEAFLAALLKDIGMLVLDQVLGAEYGELHASVASHELLAAAESARFGMSHPEAGALLASWWKLPPLLVAPIAWHHEPEKVTDPALRQFTNLAHLAGRCADVFVDETAAGAIADVRRLCLQWHGMDEPAVDALLRDVGGRTKEVARLFELSIGSPADFEAILRRANEALVEITLHSQQQAVALERQAATLQATASRLSAQNQQLQMHAAGDALTGLACRPALDAFLAARLEEAAAGGQPLSLLLLDVDRLKAVNDLHGRAAGDAALQHLGRVLHNAARARDLAVRYGGEELLLVLPGTPRAGAAALAEALRRTMAARPLRAGGATLPLTVSVGVATFEPGGASGAAMKSPAHLLKAADLAVAAAKAAGRNCVRVFGTNKPAAPSPPVHPASPPAPAGRGGPRPKAPGAAA